MLSQRERHSLAVLRTLQMDDAAFYESYWSAAGFNPRVALSPGLHRLLTRIPTSSSCLDVGCGDGSQYGTWLSNRVSSYIGVDVSQTALDLANSNGLLTRHVADASSLPFSDQTFDVVLLIDVIEHLSFPLPALVEARRVLRPGGFIFLTTPNIAYWRRRTDMFFLGRWNPLGDPLAVQQPWRDPHIRFFTLPALRRMIRSAHLTVSDSGAIEGSFAGDFPWIGARLRKEEASPVYRHLRRRLPSLFGYRLYAFATNPLKR